MKTIEIWHNPRCSKSRQALELLKKNGIEPKILLYLETPPSAARLKEVLELLDMAPRELMRKQEPPYRDLDLDNPARTPRELVAAPRLTGPRQLPRFVFVFWVRHERTCPSGHVLTVRRRIAAATGAGT